MKYFTDQRFPSGKRTAQLTIKEANARQLFLSVCRQGSTSRAALAKEAQLSPTTVSSLIDELIGQHLLLETGEVVMSKSGRRPLLLEIEGGGRCLPVMTFSPEGIAYQLYDLNFHQLDTLFFPTDYRMPLRDLVTQVLAQAQPLDSAPTPALCVVLSSVFSQHEKKILAPSLSLQWEEEDFWRLAFSLRMPVLLAEEASCCAYAALGVLERQDGRKREDLLYLEMGEGLGCGLISQGKLAVREDGALMEPGHLCVAPEGSPCFCGGRGCLVQYLGRKALLDRAFEQAAQRPESLISQRCQGKREDLDFSLLAQAFSDYDPLARELMEETAGWLALGIRNCMCLFPAHTLVLGGCQSLGEGFLYLLRRQLEKQGQERIKRLELLLSPLGKNGGGLGAVRLLVEQFMELLPE